jgi:hypothetical protein
MTRKEQIELLFQEVERGLSVIEDLYHRSISTKKLDVTILVKIKNYLENLHTILDFLAKEVMEKYCDKQVRNYFPIYRSTLTDQKNREQISGRFPGLEIKRDDIFNYFINIQPKYDKHNSWLLEFNSLCGTNKHEILSPQIRKDEIVNVLTSESGRLFIWTNGLVEFPVNKPQSMMVQPGGRIARSNIPDEFIKEDQIKYFGWIVKKLTNFEILEGPKLEQYKKEQFNRESYKVGNFYFPNQVTSIFNQLENFKEKTRGIIDQLYNFIKR